VRERKIELVYFCWILAFQNSWWCITAEVMSKCASLYPQTGKHYNTLNKTASTFHTIQLCVQTKASLCIF